MLPGNPCVDARLSGHADLSLLHAGGETLFAAPYLRESRFARDMETLGVHLCFPEMCQTAEYPHDAALNLCVVGKRLFCHKKTVPASIVYYLTNDKCFTLIPIRQGYSRCACCVVREDAVITADRGIAASAKAAGVQVLLITPGFIRLDGFPYGFIGGASFKIASDRLAFTGTLDEHPDKAAILAFLKAHGVEPVFLTDEPVFDIGSAIPITEN